MNGAYRFMGRIWRLVNDWAERFDPEWSANAAGEAEANPKAKALRRKTHQTVRKVGEDIDKFAFNTAVAALMEMTNEMYSFVQTLGAGEKSAAMSEAVEMLVLLVSPMVPHIADELWEVLGKQGFTIDQQWPDYDAEVAKADEVEVVAQVNGRVRDKMVFPADIDEESLKEAVLASEKIKAEIQGKSIVKVITVPGKLVNIVVK